MKERLIALIRGPSGSGKTFTLSQLPNAIYFDADVEGASPYVPWMTKIGSRRVPAATYQEVTHYLRKLLDTGIKNVVIDPATVLDHNSQVEANPSGEPDHGRSLRVARTQWQKLRELIRNHGFNLFVAVHQKDRYVGNVVVGQVADGPKNLEADFTVVLDIVPPAEGRPKKGRLSTAKVVKWKRHPEDQRGEVPDTLVWTIEELERVAGVSLSETREAEKPTEELLEVYRELVSKTSPPPPRVAEKWAEVPDDKLSATQIQQRIDFLRKER